MKWTVNWSFNVDADTAPTPEDAARLALESIMRDGSIAHVFTVFDEETGRITEVDLNYPELSYEN
jgi:hypothetical protein